VRVAVNVTVGVKVREGVWVTAMVTVRVSTGVLGRDPVSSSVASAVNVPAGVRVTVRAKVAEGTGVSRGVVVDAGCETGSSVGEKI
jgi:hypothetical protein